ncbi:MAG: branched-chain amino acid ABC transporter permease [Anaerolineales bacterium]|nr:branched-chain amino acid ABC transporter permease [Anaerolineales bacterium]HRX04846.1 branched-chain amino acid ABC transporter permease [Anaerolineae bacterium]
MFWQQLVNALWLGSVYALFALGYTLVFGVLDILNLAHGAVFMWGAFFGLLAVTKLNMPIWAALLVAMLGAGILGIVLDRVAFRPLRKRNAPQLAAIISSIGASTILVSLAQGAFGAQVSRFPFDTLPAQVFTAGPVRVTLVQVIVFAVSLVLMAALLLFMRRSRSGKAMRAVAYSGRISSLLGIDVDRIIVTTFFVSSALAGASGVFLGLAFSAISPFMGAPIELKGLAVIILGGLGNVPGAILAGFLLAATEVFGVAYVSSDFRDAIAFTVLILVLLIRPSGILGTAVERRA